MSLSHFQRNAQIQCVVVKCALVNKGLIVFAQNLFAVKRYFADSLLIASKYTQSAYFSENMVNIPSGVVINESALTG